MIGPEDLPHVNACLNGASALLLGVGYVAIRRRRVRFHVGCMLTALGVSLLFLVSYLYYHFAFKHGQPTHFTGEGAVRPFYYALLLSHTVLAALAAPLAIYTAYLGLCGKFARHRRVARWTWPIWLYVSITGVMVYSMLYHLYPESP
jgi:putative membrane protein